MAIITLPTTLKLEKLLIGQRRFDLSFDNAETGASSTRLLGPPRWRASFNSKQEMDLAEASEWVGFMLRLRGRVNHLALWDVARPAPRGTMRGTMTLSAAAAAGATSISITAGAGQAAKTLLEADWLQIGSGLGTSQLVAVTGGGTSNGSGVITVAVEPPLRMAFASAAPVTWDKPVTYYKNSTADTDWTYERAIQGGLAFDGLERWEG